MQLNKFNIGINTITNPIVSAQYLEAKNVDVTKEILSPINKYKIIDDTKYKDYIIKYKDFIFSSDTYINYVIKNKYIYFTSDKPYKLDIEENKLYNLGIKAPKSNLLVTKKENSIDLTKLDISFEVSEVVLEDINHMYINVVPSYNTLPSGTYEYLIVNTFGEYNSNPYVVKITLKNESYVKLYNPSSISKVVKIYRKYNDAYYYVGEIKNNDDVVIDNILNISDKDIFVDKVEFKQNTKYTFKCIYKLDDKYDYKTVDIVTNGEYRVGGFEFQYSCSNPDAELVGIFRLYDRQFYKTDNNDYDDNFDIFSNELEPPISQLSGEYHYIYTYYSSKFGLESVASPKSVSIVCDNNSVLLTNIIPSKDEQVDKIRIYRIGGTTTDYHLVAEIDNDTSKTSLLYFDSYNDISLLDDLYTSYSNYEADENLRGLLYMLGYYIGFVENKLVFSEIGQPDYWNKFNYIEFEDNITGIGKIGLGILVFLNNKTYIIQGNNIANFTKYLLSNNIGCIDYKSIQYINNQILWLGNDGIYTTNGNTFFNISNKYIHNLDLGEVISSAVYKNVYYIIGTKRKYYLDFNDNSGTIYELDNDIKTLFYDTYEDILYGINSDNNLVIMFDSDEKEEFTILTPYYSLQTGTNVKLFNEIYILFSGKIFIEVYVDGKFVNSKEYESDKIIQKTKLVSQLHQRGNFIQLKIKGTGEIYEIEFKAVGRQNGK